MTDQEVFDKVVRHLWQQGERAGDGDSCFYRGPGNMKCAVGCLIPDDTYQPAMEGAGVVELLNKTSSKYAPALEFLRPNLALLRLLQKTHDNPIYWSARERMAERLADIAETMSLNSLVVDETFGSAA